MAKKKTDATYLKRWQNYLQSLQLNEQQAMEAARGLEVEINIMRKRVSVAKKDLALLRQQIDSAKKELSKLK